MSVCTGAADRSAGTVTADGGPSPPIGGTCEATYFKNVLSSGVDAVEVVFTCPPTHPVLIRECGALGGAEWRCAQGPPRQHPRQGTALAPLPPLQRTAARVARSTP
jgi:hypothetical protein